MSSTQHYLPALPDPSLDALAHQSTSLILQALLVLLVPGVEGRAGAAQFGFECCDHQIVVGVRLHSSPKLFVHFDEVIDNRVAFATVLLLEASKFPQPHISNLIHDFALLGNQLVLLSNGGLSLFDLRINLCDFL